LATYKLPLESKAKPPGLDRFIPCCELLELDFTTGMYPSRKGVLLD
jgi:hypothetical protein